VAALSTPIDRDALSLKKAESDGRGIVTSIIPYLWYTVLPLSAPSPRAAKADRGSGRSLHIPRRCQWHRAPTKEI